MTIHQHRKIVAGNCAYCGEPFTGLKTKKFCSNACKQKNKREPVENTGYITMPTKWR